MANGGCFGLAGDLVRSILQLLHGADGFAAMDSGWYGVLLSAAAASQGLPHVLKGHRLPGFGAAADQLHRLLCNH